MTCVSCTAGNTILDGTFLSNGNSKSYALRTSSGRVPVQEGTFQGNVSMRSGQISGGRFNPAPNAAYLEDGKGTREDGGGWVTIVDKTYVASVDGTGYTSWQELFDVCGEGPITATLMSDVETLTIPAGKQVQLDNSGGYHVGALVNYGVCDIRGSALTITGGSFAADVRDLCAGEYTAQLGKNGLWEVLAPGQCEAEIDGYLYQKLSQAINAVEAGDTLTLRRDLTITGQMTFRTQPFTLDMAGHTVTYSSSGRDSGLLMIAGTSEITITGSGTFTYDGSYEGNGYIFTVLENGVLRLKDGTYHAGLTCVQGEDSGRALIEGGALFRRGVQPGGLVAAEPEGRQQRLH